jgi:hypothetical protein
MNNLPLWADQQIKEDIVLDIARQERDKDIKRITRFCIYSGALLTAGLFLGNNVLNLIPTIVIGLSIWLVMCFFGALFVFDDNPNQRSSTNG